MNKEKLNNYRLTGSIHTLAIKSRGIPDDPSTDIEQTITTSAAAAMSGAVSTSIINPNKLMGDLLTFNEFQAAMNTILADVGISEFNIIRADMRFDSYDAEHFAEFSKLNKYLIAALAVTYKVKNAYQTFNLFTQQQLNVAIKNDYFECENYDRAAKNEVTGNTVEPAQSRIEERTISRQWRLINSQRADPDAFKWGYTALQREFTDTWFARWDKALANLDRVQQVYNDQLQQLYMKDKDASPCRFRSLTDFVIQYQDCIFTKKQLVDLFARFPDEVKDPKIRAENHKKRYGIEYFSKNDVQFAIEEIKRATLLYFQIGSNLNQNSTNQN